MELITILSNYFLNSSIILVLNEVNKKFGRYSATFPYIQVYLYSRDKIMFSFVLISLLLFEASNISFKYC
jgi:hypothetical protein